MDATAQAKLVANGEATPEELVDAAIQRIEELEPTTNALSARDWELARARSRETLGGPFSGVPFLVKDLIPYPGLRYALGSRLFAKGIPALASDYSKRLDAAGLVVLGKTATSELGLLGSTETLLQGATRNPWREGLSSGGSSGGACAAVASGMVPMAHASDGGGSIRIPASMHGLFGLKPSRRRTVGAGTEDMNGLVAEHCASWSVRDSARLLAATERSAGELPPIGFVDGPSSRRLKIAVYRTTLMGQEPSSDVASAFEHTVSLCRELGHEVMEVGAPPIDGRKVSSGFFTMAGAGIVALAEMMEPVLGRPLAGEDLEPFTIELWEWYKGLASDEVAAAYSGLEEVGAQMRDYASGYDVLLCPTIPDEPHEIGWIAPTLSKEVLLERTERLAGYTAVHNIAGMPGMSVPLALSAAGLPVGSHFSAPVGQDAILLGLAYELEAARPWAQRLPFFGK